jgi:cell wall-associated NlpC family hydrolase
LLSKEAALRFASAHLGTPHSQLDCWQLVRAAYASVGIEIRADYFSALETQFRPLAREGDGGTPAPWDVVVMRNHPILTNHAGLYLGDGYFAHSLETTGFVIASLSDDPWRRPTRVVGFLRLRAQ